MKLEAILLALVLAAVAFGLRVLFVLRQSSRNRHAKKRKASEPCTTLIVLGSGGHTAEMLTLIDALDRTRYSPRWYVAAKTDTMSLNRAMAAEGAAEQQQAKVRRGPAKTAHYRSIPRSREVGQSYLTSVWTTLVALWAAVALVFRIRPELILCNGPGTCLPICVGGFLLKVFGLRDVKLVYVESIARVKKLSLTGLIFYRLGLMDQIFVQWPSLCKSYPRTKYVGRLM
ncbi:beta-1,4-N-acetylglucosaminyltransferase [Klebsormidium nitens]|uniref:UDP-N-acetylglucosamine transferase subunit ALG14 n=1 Tax=Klebsormidium nitens TaxID=105231 RepID=A0A1Y1HQM2_KLENI|nr:beta-1,4-N-acetylglucosaminyltransferase [Klebsormidium nitens]|eukprot:GAQ79489.1 beta-1,4-N-acetylglucosaminyltransferase [Klebsormidium nitens]